MDVIRMLQREDTHTDWSSFMANGCLVGYGVRSDETMGMNEMRSHLALAMLDVSDEEEDLYDR